MGKRMRSKMSTKYPSPPTNTVRLRMEESLGLSTKHLDWKKNRILMGICCPTGGLKDVFFL